MVSKNNVVEINTVCTCGVGDEEHNQKAYFENKCPTCGKEGVLTIETLNRVEVNTDSNSSDDSSTDSDSTKNNSPPLQIICKYCGAEYCGQDGYDLAGGTRGSLTSVNPNEITSDDDEVSSTEEGETTYMSGWEGLCDLLKPLDGEAMMVQRGDYVIVKKIEMPQTARLWAYEGINVVDDSVTITDYTPEIYNTFVIKWGESYENELEFVFAPHKNLFGERKTVIEAKKVSVVGEEEESDDSDKSKEWSITDLLFNSSDSEDITNMDVNDIDSASLDNATGSDGEEAPETEEVPITTLEEAKQFGMVQVGKAKRDDGHTIELKVIGNHNWMMGEWCHVRLPSFNEDCYMFISKCNFESSGDNEYINSLTLVDYPPSLGKPNKKSSDEEGEDEEQEEGEGTDTGETSGDGDSSNSESSSNSNSSSSSSSGNSNNGGNN